MLIVGVLMGSALAQTITYNFNTPFTNNVTPNGNSPWVVATISGNYLTFQSNLLPGEFIADIGMRIDNSMNVEDLMFKKTYSYGNYKNPNIYKDENGFNVAGQKFDIWFDFETSNTLNGYYRFDGHDVLTYKITPIILMSNDKIPMISHIQGIDGMCREESTWLVPCQIPETKSIFLGGMGILILFRRKL